MQNNEAVDEELGGILLADEADDAADILRSEVSLRLGSLLEMAAEDLETTGYGLRSVSLSEVRDEAEGRTSMRRWCGKLSRAAE